MDDDIDRLYDLLPAIYRLRDAERGYPLQALLRVIAEQVTVVEHDIEQLYDNWFIETAQDWVVPYIGDLIGYRLVHEAGEPGDVATAQGRARSKILIPRREVANTIRYRRRKGTLALLELLANDVAGWPARVVEFFKLLGWTQNVNHLRTEGERARTANLRNGDALDLLDGPFDQLAHTADVRRIDARPPRGRTNIPSVGLFVWRLKAYSVTKTPAHFVEKRTNCYTFSILGNDAPLFTKPQPEPEPTHIAGELNVPAPIRRRAFERRTTDYYGEKKSLEIWVQPKRGDPTRRMLRAEDLVAADLTDWKYEPGPGIVAVDPQLGRLVFAPGEAPQGDVRVTYHYGFSDDLGFGEYDRALSQPAEYTLYRVGEGEPLTRLNAALDQWQTEKPRNAVIEFSRSGLYRATDAISIVLEEGQSLQVRAANHTRPVIYLPEHHLELSDDMEITLGRESQLTLDGLMIFGRSVILKGAAGQKEKEPTSPCPTRVTIRHCTLVPGWSLNPECDPEHGEEPSLVLQDMRARVEIERSIIGSIQVEQDEVRADPIPIHIRDSIVDATDASADCDSPACEAIGRLCQGLAHAVLSIQRSTIIGRVNTHAIELAENSIFLGQVVVARRQIGCVRFCYVRPESRTPRRYNCQPDLVERAAEAAVRRLKGAPGDAEIEAAKDRERQRVRPQFNAVRYGKPEYGQLAETCADEIKRGADDESEMGVFHDLFQPQRAANLRARLAEYLPARMQAGIFYAN